MIDPDFWKDVSRMGSAYQVEYHTEERVFRHRLRKVVDGEEEVPFPDEFKYRWQEGLAPENKDTDAPDVDMSEDFDPSDETLLPAAHHVIWTTRDGSKVRVSQMHTRHLTNAYRMLLRNAPMLQRSFVQHLSDKESGMWRIASIFTGDMAQMQIEADIEDISERNVRVSYLTPEQFIERVEMVRVMRKELRDRGVTI